MPATMPARAPRRRRGAYRRKVTVQRHTTAFHVTMMIITCGLWTPFWLLDRRTYVTKVTRY
jgi:hypothetical protein